jgi:ABC-type glutathione transport system ATPase component
VGVIGESGSGKTLTALAALGMLPRGARIESGCILLGGESLLDKTERERRAIRGDRMAYIPQDALRSLNPTLRVGVQVGEPLALHRATPWNVAKRKAVELLAAVHLRDLRGGRRNGPKAVVSSTGVLSPSIPAVAHRLGLRLNRTTGRSASEQAKRRLRREQSAT